MQAMRQQVSLRRLRLFQLVLHRQVQVERIAETMKVVFHARDALSQPVILVNVKLRLFSLAMESEQKFAVAHIGKGVILNAQKT